MSSLWTNLAQIAYQDIIDTKPIGATGSVAAAAAEDLGFRSVGRVFGVGSTVFELADTFDWDIDIVSHIEFGLDYEEFICGSVEPP